MGSTASCASSLSSYHGHQAWHCAGHHIPESLPMKRHTKCKLHFKFPYSNIILKLLTHSRYTGASWPSSAPSNADPYSSSSSPHASPPSPNTPTSLPRRRRQEPPSGRRRCMSASAAFGWALFSSRQSSRARGLGLRLRSIMAAGLTLWGPSAGLGSP